MTRGHHGTGEIGAAMGPVSGWVIDGVYVAGDTIWCEEVASALAEHEPHTVVVNGGGARFLVGEPIVMDAADVGRVRGATDARVVVVHLEAINHCIQPRATYRELDGVVVPGRRRDARLTRAKAVLLHVTVWTRADVEGDNW